MQDENKSGQILNVKDDTDMEIDHSIKEKSDKDKKSMDGENQKGTKEKHNDKLVINNIADISRDDSSIAKALQVPYIAKDVPKLKERNSSRQTIDLVSNQNKNLTDLSALNIYNKTMQSKYSRTSHNHYNQVVQNCLTSFESTINMEGEPLNIEKMLLITQ